VQAELAALRSADGAAQAGWAQQEEFMRERVRLELDRDEANARSAFITLLSRCARIRCLEYRPNPVYAQVDTQSFAFSLTFAPRERRLL